MVQRVLVVIDIHIADGALMSETGKKWALENGVKLPDNFWSSCDRLYELLVETNKEYNLTRIDSYEGYLIKHVVDSLAILKYFPVLSKPGNSLADIGCGAGFPSLILALARPELRVTAIDSSGKKVVFVASAAEKLGLDNLTAFHGRTGEMVHKAEWRERFPLITARAVGSSVKIYQDAWRMLTERGRFILYKTPGQAGDELPELLKQKPQRHWKLSESFSLPDAQGERVFLYF